MGFRSVTDTQPPSHVAVATTLYAKASSVKISGRLIDRTQGLDRDRLKVVLTAFAFSLFTPKQVFGPRTAKSQPTWIKFCIHLLLYGVHLWADLDRDRRVSGSRPNQNDYAFVILVTHHKS